MSRSHYTEENKAIEERLSLVIERIALIRQEESTPKPYREYFTKVADFVLMVNEIRNKLDIGWGQTAPIEELEKANKRMYQDIIGSAYEVSYLNPAFAVARLGEQQGQALCFLYTEIRALIAYAYENNLLCFTILCELFVEIYNLFEDFHKTEIDLDQLTSQVKMSIYYFNSDYADVLLRQRIREHYDPALSFAVDIIQEADFSDDRYLYQFGEYISDNERKTAALLRTLSYAKLKEMADIYTEGFHRGYELSGKNLSSKTSVAIRFQLGFEPIIKLSIENFQKMGLKPVIFRAALNSINKKQHLKVGYFATSPNRQYDYDHRFDEAIYLDKAFKERKLAVLKTAYEENKQLAYEHAGPALMEAFGQSLFTPLSKKECLSLSEKQKEIVLEYDSQSSAMVNEYLPRSSYSFTIISYPSPEIGNDYEEIFKETIRLNTLDNEKYKQIQQKLIEALDQGEFVRVKGKRPNQTDITIALNPLKDVSKETNFENCLADVNIPLGEVFTSPQLKGTNGLLHIGQIFIKGLEYKDLMISFRNGMINKYTCYNFTDHKDGMAFVKENLLFNHATLPMGEFAIGTNTTAYAMARKYDILDRLEILIIEKMGPHFAIGDTCYNQEEDIKIYNPDGREVVAKENEISAMRHEDPEKAYYNCHTDITLSYDELDQVAVISKNGTMVVLIENGRFVLPGTEALNEPLDELLNCKKL